MLLSRVFPELWKFGSQERATRGTPIALYAVVTAAAAVRRYSTLRMFGSTSGHTVTAGRTLIITKLLYRGSATGIPWELSYGDDDVAANSAVAPANRRGIDAPMGALGNVLPVTVAATLYQVDYYGEVPAGKLLAAEHAQASDSLQLVALGVEV